MRGDRHADIVTYSRADSNTSYFSRGRRNKSVSWCWTLFNTDQSHSSPSSRLRRFRLFVVSINTL